MVKKKYVEEGGQIMQIPDEKAPEIIEVSYSKAKQLAKKPMSDKQKSNIQKLVEMNRLKWEAQKKFKDEEFKKMQAQKEQTSTKVLVKPKRIYPPRVKQAPKSDPTLNEYEDSEDVVTFPDDDDDDEEEDDDVQSYQNKPKPKAPPKPTRPTPPPSKPNVSELKMKLQQLENQLNPSNAYSGLANKFWKG